MANNRFKVDEGLVVSGNSNTEFYQEVNVYGNVKVVADLFLVTGNLFIQGNLIYTNTSISGDLAPQVNGSDLGNTTNRFDLFSININTSGNIVPSSAGLSIGNSTNRFDAFFRDLNVSGNSTLTNNTTIGGTGTINSTFYSGTSNIAFTANNANNFGGQPPSYYTNADNITTGTFPSNRLPQSTTTIGGTVILLDSVSNTSISVYAPTSNSVKTAYDTAIAANTRAASAQTEAAAAYSNAVAYVGTTSGNASALTNGTVPSARLPQATTTANGAVILLDSVSNTSVSIYAPTANSVKTAYDAAIAANTRATSAQTAATAAYSNSVTYTNSLVGNATNLTSGTVSPARLPQATTTANGAVVLLDSVSNTSVSIYAPTANSVKTAYDAAINANNNAIAANTRAASAQTEASAAYSNAIAQISNATNLTSGTVSPARLPQATTIANGAVVLLDSVSNTSISVYAPTANSVKTAYDAAIAANTRAASAQTEASSAYSNAVSVATSLSATAYSNATTYSSNATNITSGSLSLPNTSFVSVGNTTANSRITGTSISINDGATINSYSVGYKEVPQRITTTTYDLVLSDAGKHVYNTNTTGTYAITVPNNFNVAYPIGAAISIINGGNTITLAGGTNVTLRLAASTSTGTRTIANNGVATLIKVATDTWYISGAGVT